MPREACSGVLPLRASFAIGGNPLDASAKVMGAYHSAGSSLRHLEAEKILIN